MRYSLLLTGCLIGALSAHTALHAQDKSAVADRPAAQASSDTDQAAAKKQRGPQAEQRQPIARAKAFLATLSDAERQRATLEYDSEQRVAWHFIPLESRKGMPLMDMTVEQQKAARGLLRSVVSQLGYDKATTIMLLEGILLKLEGADRANVRNPEKYYFTLFGQAATGETWGLSIEGHHLSLNFSLKGNKIVDSTPQFMGSNPAELRSSFGEKFPKGLRVLRDEEQLGFELVTSLDENQLSAAMLAGDVPEEIRGAGQAQPVVEPAAGISASQLNSDQQALLKQLIETYANKMRPGVAQRRWELIDESGFDNVKFAWSGAVKPGVGHYYRIQGESFEIEFINVQADAEGNPANHIHCVWRDLQGDFNLPIE